MHLPHLFAFAALLFLTCESASIKIGVLNPMTNASSSYLTLSSAVLEGTRIAALQVNNNGGINGVPFQIVYGDLGADPNSAKRVLDSMMSANPDLVALTSTMLLQYINPVLSAMTHYNLTMVGPVAGENDLHESFSQSYIHVVPAVSAEITAIVKELLFSRNVRRIAFMSDVTVHFGNNFIPMVEQLLSNLNLSVVVYFRGNDPNSTFNQELVKFGAAKPQAVLLLGPLTTLTAQFMIAATAMMGPNFIVATTSTIVSVMIQALGGITAYGGANGRLIAGLITASPDDANLAVSAEFRAARAATPGLVFTDAVLQSAPQLKGYVMGGWLQTRVTVEILKELSTYTPAEFNKKLFATKIYTIADMIYGVYTGPCTGSRTTLCRCNEGARQLYLANIANDGRLVPLPKPSLEIPVTECDASKMEFLSPLFFGSVNPSGSIAVNSAAEFLAGSKAFDSVRVGGRSSVFLSSSYAQTTNGSAAANALVADRIVTVFTGSYFGEGLGNAPVHTTGTSFATTFDPIMAQPSLYSGYRKDVIYTLPILEQQIHALVSYAKYKGLRARLFTTRLVDGQSIHRVFQRSLDNFRIVDAGSTLDATSFAELTSIPNSVTLAFGLNSSADFLRINDVLEEDLSAHIAISFDDLRLYYSTIASDISAATLSRLLHVSSYPHWQDGGSTSSTLLQSYFSVVDQSLRTPQSLAGFVAGKIIHSIAERIPGSLTAGIFLTNLYAVSVVVLDDDIVIGSFNDDPCTASDTTASPCETNVGARQVYVRSTGGNAAATQYSHYFDSGRISYDPLPEPSTTDITVPLAVGLVGGAVVLFIVCALIYVSLFTGKNNRCAPKDSSVPFTVLFTDIQSSTALWAEIPDIMAAALEAHHSIIRKLIKRHGGYEVKTIGDSFMIAFNYSTDAVKLAEDLQRMFYDYTWPGDFIIDEMYLLFDESKIAESEMAPNDSAMLSIHLGEQDYKSAWRGLRVRVGINTAFGDIKKDEINGGYDYYGTVTNTAARTEAVAHGGQVVVTKDTVHAITDEGNKNNFTFISLGFVELRGLPEKIELFQLQAIQGRKFPSLRIEHAADDVDESLTDTTAASGASTNFEGSMRLDQSKIPLPELERLMEVTMCTVATLYSVYPSAAQKTQLKQACSKWRINLPSQSAQKADTSSQKKEDLDITRVCLKLLAKRITPIIERKLKKQKGTSIASASLRNRKDVPVSLSGSVQRDISTFQLNTLVSSWSMTKAPSLGSPLSPQNRPASPQTIFVPGATSIEDSLRAEAMPDSVNIK